MVALEHFFFVDSRSKAIVIPFWKIGLFEEVQKRVAEAALVVVLYVDYCLFL